MADLTILWVIWTFVGCVSAISGFACFFVSSIYKISFGKLGTCGLLSYILVCLILGCLILLPKRIPVSEKVKVFVGGILSGVIPSISVVYDKYVPGKSDAYAITAYGLFTLMSVSVSKKLEVGFETGFSAFFLQLFAAQLFKVKWFLLPITVVFSLFVSILRHYCSGESSQAESQSLPMFEREHARSRRRRRGRVTPTIQNIPDGGNEQNNERTSSLAAGQASQDMEGVSGQRQSTTSEDRNSQEESSQAVGEVSEKNTSDGDDEQIESQSPPVSVPEPARSRRRRRGRVTPTIQNIPDGGNEQNNERTSSLAAGQASQDMEGVSGQRQSTTSEDRNSQEESSQAVGEVSEKNTSDGDDEQIESQSPPVSVPEPARSRRRRRGRVTPTIQNIPDGGNEQNNERTSSLAAGQASQDMEGVSGQRQSTTSEDRNSQEESSQAVGEVSEKNTSDGDDEQIESQSPPVSVPEPARSRRRRRGRVTPTIQNIPDGGNEQNNERTSSLAAGSSPLPPQKVFSVLRRTSQSEQLRGKDHKLSLSGQALFGPNKTTPRPRAEEDIQKLAGHGPTLRFRKSASSKEEEDGTNPSKHPILSKKKKKHPKRP